MCWYAELAFEALNRVLAELVALQGTWMLHAVFLWLSVRRPRIGMVARAVNTECLHLQFA